MSEAAFTRAALAAHNLRPKKAWGQNFCLNAHLLARIASLPAAPAGRLVVELGAGLGALTAALLAAGHQVLAVERDRELVPLLTERFAGHPGLRVHAADAARLDYAALAAEAGGPVAVVGNLPYQISSRILVALAQAGESVAEAAVLVQREVAERLVADPGSRTYGLLTVLVRQRFHARMVAQAGPNDFLPPPQVDSAVVHLLPAAHGIGAPEQLIVAARAAFGARRKTLRRALADACGCGVEQMAAVCVAAEVAPEARAETLDLAAFARLGAALAAAGLRPRGLHA